MLLKWIHKIKQIFYFKVENKKLIFIILQKFNFILFIQFSSPHRKNNSDAMETLKLCHFYVPDNGTLSLLLMCVTHLNLSVSIARDSIFAVAVPPSVYRIAWSSVTLTNVSSGPTKVFHFH